MEPLHVDSRRARGLQRPRMTGAGGSVLGNSFNQTHAPGARGRDGLYSKQNAQTVTAMHVNATALPPTVSACRQAAHDIAAHTEARAAKTGSCGCNQPTLQLARDACAAWHGCVRCSNLQRRRHSPHASSSLALAPLTTCGRRVLTSWLP